MSLMREMDREDVSNEDFTACGCDCELGGFRAAPVGQSLMHQAQTP